MYQLRKADSSDYDFVFNLNKAVYTDYIDYVLVVGTRRSRDNSATIGSNQGFRLFQ